MRVVFLCVALLAVLCAAAPSGKHFDHVMIIQFENHANWEVGLDPNFRKIASLGTHLTDYHAVAHPSQPNYVAQIAGSTLGVHNDDYVTFPENVTNLVDLLEAKGLSWKGYMQSYPGNCYDGDTTGWDRYMRKHNPFMGFENIRHNPKRCANIVNADQLYTDIENGDLPNFFYFTPNMDNDAHDTNITYAGKFLISFLPELLNNPTFMNNTMVVITWDEDDYTEFNRVFTVLLGPNVKSNSKDGKYYTHYSLLRTIEDNWDLGNLGRNDATATPFDYSNYLHAL